MVEEGLLKSEEKLGHPMLMCVAHSTLAETEIDGKFLRHGLCAFCISLYSWVLPGCNLLLPSITSNEVSHA